jgi:acetoin:2,6-dichlorophenolindophenol oxidoreductase subunit beta
MKKKFNEIVNLVFFQAMKENQKVVCFGLGATDPKGIFGTTVGLQKKFGNHRVFDVPASENALTGFAIGMSMKGYLPILTHQRLDFALLSMDQIVNGAAKWFYMFGGKQNVPIVIRMIIGRGWGQGPTHSQNLQSFFAHIPGLKVISASTPNEVGNLLYSSIFDPNPVIFLEHRWLHEITGKSPKKFKNVNLNKCKILKRGNGITLITHSYMVLECLKASKILKAEMNIDCEVVDLVSLSPVDYNTLIKSVKKTKKALIIDTSNASCGIAPTVKSYLDTYFFNKGKYEFRMMTMPFAPEPTSYGLTKSYYNDYKSVITEVLSFYNKKKKLKLIEEKHHDVPGEWFKGPF